MFAIEQKKLLYYRNQVACSQQIRQITQENQSQKLKKWKHRLGAWHKICKAKWRKNLAGYKYFRKGKEKVIAER